MKTLQLCTFVVLCTLLLQGAFASTPVFQQTQVETQDNPFLSRAKPIDVTKMSSKNILDHFGLGHAVPFFTDMLDHADDMFKFATRDQHFVMVNRVLGALKNAFLNTIKLVQKAPVPLPQVIDKDMIDQVAEVMERQFHDLIQKDPDVDLGQVEPFFRTYADHFFLAMRNGYKTLFDMGISLTWTIVYMATGYIEKLDTEVLNRDMFKDVLDVPEHLKQFLYDNLAEVMTSSYGHFIQMGAAFLSTINLKKLMAGKFDL